MSSEQRRKFKVGDYACLFHNTPSFIYKKWKTTIEEGGYIRVAKARESHWSNSVTYDFYLHTSKGQKVDSYSTTGHAFGKANEPAIAKKSPMELLEKEVEKVKARISDLEASLEKEQVNLAYARSRVSYMKEHGLETFDEKEYQAYLVLQVLEEKEDLPRLEKAKLIASIVK